MPAIEMTRDEAIEIVGIHSIATSETLFPGGLPADILNAWKGPLKRLLDKYEGTAELTLRLVLALRMLSPPPVGSDYERDLEDDMRSSSL